MAANGPRRQDGSGPKAERVPLEEVIGRYVLRQPLVRSALERPDIALPWIILGLAVAFVGLVWGMPSVILALLVGLPILFGARLLAPRQRNRPSAPLRPLRLVLLLAWLAATVAAVVVVFNVDAATGSSGTVRLVGLAIVLPIAVKALQMIWRE